MPVHDFVRRAVGSFVGSFAGSVRSLRASLSLGNLITSNLIRYLFDCAAVIWIRFAFISLSNNLSFADFAIFFVGFLIL